MADADVSMTLLAGDLRQKQGSDWKHGTSARDHSPLNLLSAENPHQSQPKCCWILRMKFSNGYVYKNNKPDANKTLEEALLPT
tara:strand:- start:503 stop:751 length:249 start_codon:yes stop_codon:yes gene_type:complete